MTCKIGNILRLRTVAMTLSRGRSQWRHGQRATMMDCRHPVISELDQHPNRQIIALLSSSVLWQLIVEVFYHTHNATTQTEFQIIVPTANSLWFIRKLFAFLTPHIGSGYVHISTLRLLVPRNVAKYNMIKIRRQIQICKKKHWYIYIYNLI